MSTWVEGSSGKPARGGRASTIAPRRGFVSRLLGLGLLGSAVLFGLGAERAEAGMVVRPSHAAVAARAQTLKAFLTDLWPEARARGITAQTFDAAFLGVTLDPSVIARTKLQAEFRKTLGDYLAAAVSDKRIATGREKYKQWGNWAARAEEHFGVDRYVILGIWGIESNFGKNMGDDYVMRSLATLAATHYRGTYFRMEVLKALEILQEGDIDPAHMVGSWAGAMGQTQFMPSSFRTYAVDFDHHGKRDIWNDVPDALGSTANFLHKHGWISGETWGYEVFLPPGFGGRAARGSYINFATWADRGLIRADGGEMPRTGKAMLLRPAGPTGPAFLVTPNFKVLKSYNNSTAYALAVCLLGDRIAGWGPLKGRWPIASR